MHGTSSKEAGVKKPPRQTGPSPALTRARKLQAAKGSHTTGKTGIPTPTSRPLNRATPGSCGRAAKSGPTPSSLKLVVLTTTCSKAAMLSSPQQDVHDSEEGSTTSSSTSSPSSSSSWEHETPPSSPTTGTERETEETGSPKPKKLAATGARGKRAASIPRNHRLVASPPGALFLPIADIKVDVTQDIEIGWEFFESLRRGRKPRQPSADSASPENRETPAVVLSAHHDDVRGESQAASSQTIEAGRAPAALSVSLAHEQAPSLSITSFPAVLPSTTRGDVPEEQQSGQGGPLLLSRSEGVAERRL
ncbi:hypothetical protein HPB51_025284 [Rhipicephalus microplus]|uniref:Uncharacterized protein n=1 Tax=Rhipicephalus microplus TaxID=6941 RepID=A0A9J6E4N8_RHIMP|nr:hypothetical protein HPB51_025284 [Rhipicephalus microplus]